MSGAPTLFLDRDGTLIEEPPDHQVDALSKVRFMPGVFAALIALKRRGFRFVMVTNQDGLGTEAFPRAAFEAVQTFVVESFRSQSIEFEAVFICPHRQVDGCACRKPQTGFLTDHFLQTSVDLSRSAVIGDRETDLELARNLGIRGLRVSLNGTGAESWPEIAQSLSAREAQVQRQTRETKIDVRVALDVQSPIRVATGIGFFDHMLEQLAHHGGFALQLDCHGDLSVDEHHTVEDCALALGAALRRAVGSKLGISRYGFVLPMDEALVQVAVDLGGRPWAAFRGRFNREQVGGLPTELVPHFFHSLAIALGSAVHIRVSGENAHHMIEACFKGVGRALRQALRLESEVMPSTKGIL